MGVRTASRYLLAILITIVATRYWLVGGGDGDRAALAQRRPDARRDRAAPTAPAPDFVQGADVARPDIPADLLRQAEADEQINIRVYAAVNKGVVNITAATAGGGFFGDETTPNGSGSGFVIDREGHILTNFHVVEGADSLQITLPDGSTRDARVVGTDASNDVAVIRAAVPAGTLTPLVLGDSANLLVGQKVLAIGNPFGLERTLTTGIISSLDRSIQAKNGRKIKGIIQTDAAINPGNSGGPLLNPRGEVIGMNTAILSQVGQSAGIGFAVPINSIKRILRPLIDQGRVVRGDLGLVRVMRVNDGLLVIELAGGGPAERAGLREPEVKRYVQRNVAYLRPDLKTADLIIAVDGKPVRTSDELLGEVETHPPGAEVTLTVIREGRKVQVPVTLGES